MGLCAPPAAVAPHLTLTLRTARSNDAMKSYIRDDAQHLQPDQLRLASILSFCFSLLLATCDTDTPLRRLVVATTWVYLLVSGNPMGLFNKSSTPVESAPPPASNHSTSLLGCHKSTSSRPSTETERHGVFSRNRSSLDESRSGHRAAATVVGGDGGGGRGLHLFSKSVPALLGGTILS